MNIAIIESLDHEGRGVAHVEGKVVFIEGALPGERVRYARLRSKPKFDTGRVEDILEPSSQRVAPRCPHFGICGGCSMQHLEPGAQAAVKQRVLEDAFWHIARLEPETMLPPIIGPAWGYRRRARLAVRFVAKKGGVLVGFHEKKSSFVADMTSCAVLPAPISALLPALRTLVGRLSIAQQLPQIEVAVGDGPPVLVLRILEPLTAADEDVLRGFADRHGVHLWLQPGGPDTATPFHPAEAPLPVYRLADFAVGLRFRPTDFTQVNHDVNRVLVRRAIGLLAPRPKERIADMFCGLGNFTLPLARCGATVVGVEGSAPLVARARENALANGLAARIDYHVANLFAVTPEQLSGWGCFDKMLIDPPREGAIELVKCLGSDAPARIVYVSCNPATLARDAAVLVHEKGYRLRAAGIANMFPHTSHVESIALFERG
ncbi:23S rRNA (uracil(1939)-C(5))-methyltransferase RlmD [Sulfuricystis multivorans]|uniref:23S rRNA (uracil(1939)-C(5))-methyltransferase RlmD n=1 Tax=Sulfuricystis multivorans TaxID=2211108 RepID=UPI000F8303CC|nr:23S rRNA (uracil(1939)-C(5))-methyltransferase RlmD [Sulfuricystis multivorans]